MAWVGRAHAQVGSLGGPVIRILMADFPVICFVPRALYLESISELFVLDSDLPLL